MGFHYLHSPPGPQRDGKTRHSPLNLPLQSLWLDLDLPLQSLFEHLHPTYSRIHGVRDAFQLEDLHCFVYHNPDDYPAIHWI